MRVRIYPRLAGWKHYISHSEAMAVNGPARLVRTPDNEHDSNAIEVHYGNQHIGHVPRDVAYDLARLIDDGHHFDAMARRVDGGDFVSSGEKVEWAHIKITITSDDLSDENALRLCNIDEVFASYMVGNEFVPAHRTRRQWQEAGRRLRPNVIFISTHEHKPSNQNAVYWELYSVADLTMPKGATQWPGWFK